MTGILILTLLAGADRAKAAELMAKKNFAAACPMLKAVTKDSPKDGGAWADLSTCYLGQKKNKDAIAAALAAVKLDDAEGRKTAYVTLALAGFEKKLPAAQPDDAEPKCSSIPSAAPCKTPVFVCTTAEAMETETRDTKSEAKIGFGLTKDAAVANKAKNTFSKSQHHGSEGFDSECVLVAVDGCAKRAGYVCTTSSNASAEPKTEPTEVEVP